MNSKQVVESVLSARYLREGEKTFEDVFHRVAYAIADNNAEASHFYDLMSSSRFLPNSPTLMNAGTDLGRAVRMFRSARP